MCWRNVILLTIQIPGILKLFFSERLSDTKQRQAWLKNFTSEPAPLTEAEKAEFVKTLSGFPLSSGLFTECSCLLFSRNPGKSTMPLVFCKLL